MIDQLDPIEEQDRDRQTEKFSPPNDEDSRIEIVRPFDSDYRISVNGEHRETVKTAEDLIQWLTDHLIDPVSPPPPADSPTTCIQCGGTNFVCRENVPQEWPMASNKGGVSIVFETSDGAELDYDACHGAAVYCADCGNEEPDVGIEFSDDTPDDDDED